MFVTDSATLSYYLPSSSSSTAIYLQANGHVLHVRIVQRSFYHLEALLFWSVLFYHYYSISPCHFLCFTAGNIFISFIFGWLGFIVFFLTTLHFLLPPNSFTANWATSGANADASTGRKLPCYPLLFPSIDRLFLINYLSSIISVS